MHSRVLTTWLTEKALRRVLAGLVFVLTSLSAMCTVDVHADEADAALNRRIDVAVADLSADDADARKRAVATIVELAPASFGVLARSLPDPENHAGWAAALAAAARAGPEVVLRELQATRSNWRGLSATVVARYIDEVFARWERGQVVTLSTEETTLTDPARLPPAAALPIADELRSELSWGEYPTRIGKNGALQLATSDPARFSKTIPRGGWEVLRLGSKNWPRRLMVFDRGGAWMVASAAARSGSARGVSVLLLDVDGDGEFGGASDLIAIDDGAFQEIGRAPYVWALGGRCRVQIKRDVDGVAVELRRMPDPEGPGRNVLAWAWVNQWRASVGLPPHALDRPRSEACAEHHEYWQHNGFTAHDQNAQKPGASPTGAKAGRSSSVWETSDPLRLAEAISRNVLHRRSLLGRGDDGLGLAGGPAGSLLWGGAMSRRSARTPLLVPAPGQTGVPLDVRAESPAPASNPNFYAKSHGYPVAVHFAAAGTRLADVSLTLETAQGAKPVSGTLFKPSQPYHPNYNANEAVFVADSPLREKTWYLARFRASDDQGAFEVSWWFTTGDARFPTRTGRK